MSSLGDQSGMVDGARAVQVFFGEASMVWLLWLIKAGGGGGLHEAFLCHSSGARYAMTWSDLWRRNKTGRDELVKLS